VPTGALPVSQLANSVANRRRMTEANFEGLMPQCVATIRPASDARSGRVDYPLPISARFSVNAAA
jgi:hypothetical protein